jgi:hypothetical protein
MNCTAAKIARKNRANKKAGDICRPLDSKGSTSDDAGQGVNAEIQSGRQIPAWRAFRTQFGHRIRSEKWRHRKSVDLSITSPAHYSSPGHLGANANAVLVIIWHNIIMI